uniref:Uncharacterized protein n=1 Tax=Nelumbo nucifera TaxID=4432 RepID=A0A822XRW1_NELNU|nr:TPA_asm: hypothetical protein HUJ06_021681 [Nelumbo nucifera]
MVRNFKEGFSNLPFFVYTSGQKNARLKSGVNKTYRTSSEVQGQFSVTEKAINLLNHKEKKTKTNHFLKIKNNNNIVAEAILEAWQTISDFLVKIIPDS